MTVLADEHEQIGVAVSGVHAGLGVGNVDGELRNREEFEAVETEHFDGPRTGRRDALDLGNTHDHESSLKSEVTSATSRFG